MRKWHSKVHHDDSYNSEMKLGGVIYLYDISLSRMLGTTRKNLEMFQKLCGDDAFGSVILGTTKWGDIFKEDGDTGTQQLRDNYWRDMLHHGSQVFKFEDSSRSAWTMVDSILELNRSRAEVLHSQRDLVDAPKVGIPDIEAVQKATDARFTDAKKGDIIVPHVSFPSNFNQSR